MLRSQFFHQITGAHDEACHRRMGGNVLKIQYAAGRFDHDPQGQSRPERRQFLLYTADLFRAFDFWH